MRGPEGGSEGENPSPARVLIKNDSGSDAPTGGVLKLTGVVHEPAVEPGCEYNGPIFTGGVPAANEQHVAILSEPIADGFLGWGVIPNAAWAKVNVSNAAHEYAQPKASVAELDSHVAVGFPIIWKESGTGAGKWAVVSLGKADPGNVIYAQVVGAVGSGDPTGTFDNAVSIVGSIPTGGTGTFQNENHEELAYPQWVLLFQRKDNQEWIPDRAGTSATLLRFETTAAKDWNASTVAGVLLDASNAPVGDPITLTDRPPAKHEAIIGSRGYCIFSGGEYWIVTMDSPARWVEGALNADWDLSADSAVMTKDDWWGASPNHLMPVDSTITIWDILKVRSRKYFSGEKVRALWDEKRKKFYVANPPGDYITIKGTTGAVTRSTATFTLSEPVGVNGQVPTGTITVTNDPPINTPGGRTIYARFNYSIGTNLQTAWDTGDAGNFRHHLRGLLDGGTEDRMVVDWHTASGEGSTDDPHWHKVAACTPPA